MNVHRVEEQEDDNGDEEAAAPSGSNVENTAGDDDEDFDPNDYPANSEPSAASKQTVYSIEPGSDDDYGSDSD